LLDQLLDRFAIEQEIFERLKTLAHAGRWRSACGKMKI
jgi:hypothetical protein